MISFKGTKVGWYAVGTFILVVCQNSINTTILKARCMKIGGKLVYNDFKIWTYQGIYQYCNRDGIYVCSNSKTVFSIIIGSNCCQSFVNFSIASKLGTILVRPIPKFLMSRFAMSRYR